MYRITYEIAELLLKNPQDPLVPGIIGDDKKPFVAKNKHSIGYLDPICVCGADYDYIVESDYPLTEGMHEPGAEGFWLYKRDELKSAQNVSVPRGLVEAYSLLDPEEPLDITDCCIETPSIVDKLTCLQVTSLSRLFEMEPNLKKCILKKNI